MYKFLKVLIAIMVVVGYGVMMYINSDKVSLMEWLIYIPIIIIVCIIVVRNVFDDD